MASCGSERGECGVRGMDGWGSVWVHGWCVCVRVFMCVRHRGGWRIDVDVVGAYFVCCECESESVLNRLYNSIGIESMRSGTAVFGRVGVSCI